MTGRVHVLTKAPDHQRHERCLAMLCQADTLVLSAKALEQLAASTALPSIAAGRVLALAQAPETLALPDGWEPLDHVAFVEHILSRHQPVFW